ncbi:hypotheical protein [Mycobacterium phage PP]|uniref:Hypotheical protein n=1 Tax=Mycobacterium phage PP TaxID=2077134 RepID=A0A2Z5XVJ4_9CAUD|nr:hypothetical protein KIW36_gp18 [Mycobacterium phage PP]BBC53873.1 hypotheical protein [Mycobacterium phage PP]
MSYELQERLTMAREAERDAKLAKLRAGHKNPFRLSENHLAALRDAAGRWDDGVWGGRKVWGGLAARGLVDLRRGRSTGKYGETLYNVIVGVKINKYGRRVVELMEGNGGFAPADWERA